MSIDITQTKLLKNPYAAFTLVEVLFVLAIFTILLVGSFVVFAGFRDDSALENETNNVEAILRLAQSKTVASEGDIQHGVYFNTAPTPHEYVLFQTNTDYAARITSEDEIYVVSDLVQFSSAVFAGLSGQEVVFERIQGTTVNSGEVILQSVLDAGNTKTVSVGGGGNVQRGSVVLGDEGNCQSHPTSPGDRLCDSRHMHVTYSGYSLPRIETATETIILDFESGAHLETIVIADNLVGGQIVWENTIDVGGESQHIKMHTHQLNGGAGSNETIFSIHRGLEDNTKSLDITMSADTNTIISYDAAGVVTAGTSIYVTDTQEQ